MEYLIISGCFRSTESYNNLVYEKEKSNEKANQAKEI